MGKNLFTEFNPVSPAAWKQKIQVDLKGADYNDTLVWQTAEGITVKPFYTKEDRNNEHINLPEKEVNICQSIIITNEKSANSLGLDALERGANAIQFTASQPFNPKPLLKGFPGDTPLYFKFNFLDAGFQSELAKFCHDKHTYLQIDPIGHLAESGNSYHTFKGDLQHLEKIKNNAKNCISVQGDLYQNAGANAAQQLAYILAHANEYLNIFGAEIAPKINFTFAVGSHYFLEIAKLRAFRMLWNSLLTEYNHKDSSAHIFTTPSLRNKTLYDYNVNMLRTTTECMSSILGGSNTVCNVAYDSLYQKPNEFGERIARNQLLILQEESYFKKAQTFANGSYYIESITKQLTEKALTIFKMIEKGGGLLKQLKEGAIQKKITESAKTEQEKFDKGELVLLGTNLLPNVEDRMRANLDLDPFVRKRKVKTKIIPIVRKRLSEKIEKERLTNE